MGQHFAQIAVLTLGVLYVCFKDKDCKTGSIFLKRELSFYRKIIFKSCTADLILDLIKKDYTYGVLV